MCDISGRLEGISAGSLERLWDLTNHTKQPPVYTPAAQGRQLTLLELHRLQENLRSTSPGWVAGIGLHAVNSSHKGVSYGNGGKYANQGVRRL